MWVLVHNLKDSLPTQAAEHHGKQHISTSALLQSPSRQSATAGASKSEITLKGSVEIVAEFFH